MQSIIILGATGLLGPYVIKALEEQYHVVSFGHTKGSHRIKIKNAASIEAIIEQHKPVAIINLIALTNVDLCEKSYLKSAYVNALIPRYVVQALANKKMHHTHFVQISTDQIYNGSPRLHKEKDVDPINIYGLTKYLGEQEALKHNNTIILRTNIFGASQTENRESISDFFKRVFSAQEKVNLFTDSVFSPLHMKTLADIIKLSIEKQVTGIFNAGSHNALSKAKFADLVAQKFNLSTDCANYINAKDLPNRAPRPLNLGLNSEKLEQALALKLPTLQEEIEKL